MNFMLQNAMKDQVPVDFRAVHTMPESLKLYKNILHEAFKPIVLSDIRFDNSY